mmetsp:Transcript_34760/g.41582  ORF Transcript_34760/g.41582 Transcript_34760/m.41582 type:complete len:131 (+) Transcript_34760:128-520(+)
MSRFWAGVASSSSESGSSSDESSSDSSAASGKQKKVWVDDSSESDSDDEARVAKSQKNTHLRIPRTLHHLHPPLHQNPRLHLHPLQFRNPYENNLLLQNEIHNRRAWRAPPFLYQSAGETGGFCGVAEEG